MAFTFIDLFAGIGGIRIAFEKVKGECVFTSEWDKFSQITYEANFKDKPDGDITKINVQDIPKHDILLGGFPCQPFSNAGLKQGFDDTRGTLFFDVARIIDYRKPSMILLENVKGFVNHDKGRTMKIVTETLEELGYNVFYKVLNARDFGVPQNRERIFIVGFDRGYYGNKIDFSRIFNWCEPPFTPTRLGDILENDENIDDKYTLSDKLWNGHLRRKKEHIEK
jgi:DNA (cytosine-5)-methyltransferase 1